MSGIKPIIPFGPVFYSLLILSGPISFALPDNPIWSGHPELLPKILQVKMTCKSVYSCEDAVALWCSGYGRADGDGDGVPCETVCSSKEQVDEIIARNGC